MKRPDSTELTLSGPTVYKNDGFVPHRKAISRRESEVQTCDVQGCCNPSERSFNIKQVSKSSLELKSSDLRQVHLCKQHYREFKKDTKGDRALDAVY